MLGCARPCNLSPKTTKLGRVTLFSSSKSPPSLDLPPNLGNFRKNSPFQGPVNSTFLSFPRS